MSLGMKLNIQLTSKGIDGIFIKLVTYSQGVDLKMVVIAPRGEPK